MYLLVDCNNFFVSCEELKRPDLKGKPVVVLSGAGGIVLARSKEAKVLGIPMGAPSFQYKTLFLSKNVITLFVNFSLYAEISERVMDTLERFGLTMEIYSIDEAFLQIKESNDYLSLGSEIRSKILNDIGITVSVGIAPTKTLAKVAGDLAKKGAGVVLFSDGKAAEYALKNLLISDVWGFGHRTTEALKGFGVRSALDLTQKPDEWIQKHLSIVGLRTVFELRGQPCLTIEEGPPQKSIVRSRSFDARIGTRERLEEIISSFAASIAKHLRRQGLKANNLAVFIVSHTHTSQHITLEEPSSYTPLLITKAKECLRSLYQQGQLYKKAGVLVYELTDASEHQLDFFNTTKSQNAPLMHTLDLINKRYGKNSLYFAAEPKDL